MVKAKKWVLVKEFGKVADMSDFKLEEENLPDTLKEGEVLCEAAFMTVDPYMRVLPTHVGCVMQGEQVARVTASKNSAFPVGCCVSGMLGWRTHTIVSNVTEIHMFDGITPFPIMHVINKDIGSFPLSVYLGAMGMPGMTAYFGFLDECKPKPGETVLVSGAAGAVGSLVLQIAKIKGCHVIGSAGTDEKCKWLKDLGADDTINYKTCSSLDEELKKLAPKGINYYFDNVGGDFTVTVINHMALRGRITCCGSISTYNTASAKGGIVTGPITGKMLTLKGILGWAEIERWPEGQAQMLKWIQEGKIQIKETITEGFDNMAQAFLDLFKGKNTGKAIIKV